MRLQERYLADLVIVDLSGRCAEAEDAWQVENSVQGIVARGGRKILLNLEKVEYISSTGLGALVRSFTLTSKAGGKLWLSYPTKRVHDLLSITKLLPVFDIVEPRDLVGALAEQQLEASCPTCDPPAWLTLQVGAEYQSCLRCGTRLKLASWPVVPDGETVEAPCAVVCVKTYEGEFVELVTSDVHTIAIEKRVDQFSCDIVKDIWSLVPPPRRVIFTVGRRSYSEKGLKSLLHLCAMSNGDDRAVVLFHQDALGSRDALPDHPAIHGDLDSARSALNLTGEPLGGPRLTVRRA